MKWMYFAIALLLIPIVHAQSASTAIKTIWYIVGGIIVLLVTIRIIMSARRRLHNKAHEEWRAFKGEHNHGHIHVDDRLEMLEAQLRKTESILSKRNS